MEALKDVPNVIDVQYTDAAKNYEQEIVAYIDESRPRVKPDAETLGACS